MGSCAPITHVIVTGSTGLLGRAVLQAAPVMLPGVEVRELCSARHGGVDLCDEAACERLLRECPLPHPQGTVLLHCAADISWTGQAVVENNFRMAVNTARWARQSGVAFSVCVSSVSVFEPGSRISMESPCLPRTPYGMGKLAAEFAWRALLEPDRQGIVRLAGLLGWQREPAMFWNRLLKRAAEDGKGETPESEFNPASTRNYLTAPEAARCLLRVAMGHHADIHLAAGAGAVTALEFMRRLEQLRDAPLPAVSGAPVDDVILYEPSPLVRPWLMPWEASLEELWEQRPA